MSKEILWQSLVGAAVAAAIALPLPAAAKTFEFESGTLLRMFEQEKPDGEKATGLPLFEYLSADAYESGVEGLSGHVFAWGRHDLGDYYDDESDSELVTGYLEYRYSQANFTAKLGRHNLSQGPVFETIDGISVGGDVTGAFGWSAFYGLPAALEETEGSNGDSLWGGKVTARLAGVGEIGASYQRAENDGDLQRELVGFDGSLTTYRAFSLFGKSVLNADSGKWREHNWEARVYLGQLMVKPVFRYIDYDSFFDTDAYSYRAFSEPVGGRPALFQSGEKLTMVGAEVLSGPIESIEVGAKFNSYSYEKREDSANYIAGTIEYRGKGLTAAGIEGGRMDGGIPEDSYNLFRIWGYYEFLPAFASVDAIYAKYDEKVLGSNGDDTSLNVSVAGGMGFFDNALKLKLAADYSQTPYFDSDLRGTLLVEYLFTK